MVGSEESATYLDVFGMLKATPGPRRQQVWRIRATCGKLTRVVRAGTEFKVAATCIITQVKGMLCSEVSDRQVAERGAGLAPRFLYTTPAWT